MFEGLIKRWLTYWHGVPTDPQHQYAYYRCEGCKELVTWRTIANGGCECGLSNRIRPAVLKRRDKVRLILRPWSVG